MSQFTIRVSGAPDVSFPCSAQDSLLSAALRAGVPFPYECNSGGCGSCRFELVHGEIDESWSEAPGISKRMRDRGLRLACQSRPTADCELKFAMAAADPLPQPPQDRRGVLVGRRMLTHDMVELQFKTSGPAEFLPGQFAMLTLEGVVGRRAYSMSSLPNAEGFWEFIVKKMPGGHGSALLVDGLSIGDEIGIDAAYGKSYYRAKEGRGVVCIAGGSGLSPVLSILRAAVPTSPDVPIHLFYGAREPRDVCLDKLLNHPSSLEGVQVHTAISAHEGVTDEQWSGARGFVHEVVAQVLKDRFENFDFYLCGPGPMIDAVMRLLVLEAGVSQECIYFDRFF